MVKTISTNRSGFRLSQLAEILLNSIEPRMDLFPQLKKNLKLTIYIYKKTKIFQVKFLCLWYPILKNYVSGARIV
ncbi:MAG: hypothetical protein ACTSX0_13795 [Promethearchaeota archaeon]